MDDYCAPQWVDFTQSPQIPSDDFFDVQHNEHEPFDQDKENNETQFSNSLLSEDDADVTIMEFDAIKNTPIKVISPTYKNGEKCMTYKETTTYEEVLNDAMKNLTILSKKPLKSNHNLANHSIQKLSSTASTISLPTTTPTKGRTKKSYLDTPIPKPSNKTHISTELKTPICDSSELKTPIPSSSSKLKISISTSSKFKTSVTNSKNYEASVSTFKSKTSISTSAKSEISVTDKCCTAKEIKTNISNTKLNKSSDEKPFDSEDNKILSNTEEDKNNYASSKDEMDDVDIINEILNHKKSKDDLIIKKEESNICTDNWESESDINSSPQKVSAQNRKPISKVLTCQYVKQSSKLRRKSNQYLSLAEGVSKFQNDTPKRFRTTKGSKSNHLTNFKQNNLKLTVAVSPALISKNRVRPTKVLSHDEREKLEMEEMKKQQIKANPVKKSTFRPPLITKKVEKKVTVPVPFHLTEIKKHATTNCNANLAMNNAQVVNKKPLIKKNVTKSVIQTDHSNTITVAEKELLHFGIPMHGNKRYCHTTPSAFEARAKDFLAKKEQKLKKLQASEDSKIKTDFHAKPAPKFCKSSQQSLAASTSKTVAKSNLTNSNKPTGRPVSTSNMKTVRSASVGNIKNATSASTCNSKITSKSALAQSFEERNKQLVKKKEEAVKQAMLEERKARQFHAQPVPEFKPVLVRGLSKESLKSKESTKNIKNARASMPSKLLTKSKSAQNLMNNTCNITKNVKKGNQENNQPNIISSNKKISTSQTKEDEKLKNQGMPIKIKPPLLSTDRRALERRQFDERMKQKEMEEQARRLRENEKKLQQEKASVAEMRKLTEIKAKPMPVYKPHLLVKSTKPLTNPESPMWQSKIKKQLNSSS